MKRVVNKNVDADPLQNIDTFLPLAVYQEYKYTLSLEDMAEMSDVPVEAFTKLIERAVEQGELWEDESNELEALINGTKKFQTPLPSENSSKTVSMIRR